MVVLSGRMAASVCFTIYTMPIEFILFALLWVDAHSFTLGSGETWQSTNVQFDIGVQLARSTHADELSDAFYVYPALLAAQLDAWKDYKVRFDYQINWYQIEDDCDMETTKHTLEATRGVLALISGTGLPVEVPPPNPPPVVKWAQQWSVVGKSYGPAALKHLIILGPACTTHFSAAALATSSLELRTMLVSGQAHLLRCTAETPVSVRTGYDIHTMWFMLTFGMAKLYNWKDFAFIYDSNQEAYKTYYDALKILVYGGDVEGCEPRMQTPSVPGQSLTECPCTWDTVNTTLGYNETTLKICLSCAAKQSRIIVLAAGVRQIRALLITAQKHKELYLNEEFVYLTTDVYHKGLVRVKDNQAKPWMRDDGYDSAVEEALSYMFVIGLEPFEIRSQFTELQVKAKTQIDTLQAGSGGAEWKPKNEKTNKPIDYTLTYIAGTYYDAAMILAATLRHVRDDMEVHREYSAAAPSDPPSGAPTDKMCLSGSGGFMAQYPLEKSGNYAAERCYLYYVFNKLVTHFTPASRFKGATGNFFIKDSGDRLNQWNLYAFDAVTKQYSSVVGVYDNSDEAAVLQTSKEKPIPWKTKNGLAPKNKPECGYARECPVNIYVIAGGVGGPLLLIAAVVIWHLRRKAKIQAKIDYDWIAPLRQLVFNKKKTAVQGVPGVNIPEPSESEHDLGKSMGKSMGQSMGSMGQSMGASLGQSLGNSAHMSMSMRKRMLAMSDHFGTWSKQPVVMRWTKRKRVVVTPQVIREVRIVRKISHGNVAHFVGGCVDEGHVCVLYEMCNKGPLDMMFGTEGSVKLDWVIRMAWVKDLVNAMHYIHGSPIGSHTRLTSKCCFIDGRFALKITDYGLPSIFTPTMSETWTAKRSPQFGSEFLWTCPERLRADTTGTSAVGTKEGDVYSFAIILQEIILKTKPYSMYPTMTSLEIVDEVRKGISMTGQPFRPDIKESDEIPVGLLPLCHKCWSEDPTQRPMFDKLRTQVRAIAKDMNMGDSTNIMDVFLQQMEESENVLKDTVEEKDNDLVEQKETSDQAYHLVFPETVADLVMNSEEVEPFLYENVTLLRTDVLGFETLCVESKPADIAKFLDDFYFMFDDLMANFLVFVTDKQADCLSVSLGREKKYPVDPTT